MLLSVFGDQNNCCFFCLLFVVKFRMMTNTKTISCLTDGISGIKRHFKSFDETDMDEPPFKRQNLGQTTTNTNINIVDQELYVLFNYICHLFLYLFFVVLF